MCCPEFTINQTGMSTINEYTIVSSCSGESDNRAQGAEGLADEEGSINLAEGYSLLLESVGPIGAEYCFLIAQMQLAPQA